MKSMKICPNVGQTYSSYLYFLNHFLSGVRYGGEYSRVEEIIVFHYGQEYFTEYFTEYLYLIFLFTQISTPKC